LHDLVAIDLGVLFNVLNLSTLVQVCSFGRIAYMLRSLKSNKFLLGDTAGKPSESRHCVFVIGFRGHGCHQIVVSLRCYVALHLDDPFPGDGICAIDSGQRGSNDQRDKSEKDWSIHVSEPFESNMLEGMSKGLGFREKVRGRILHVELYLHQRQNRNLNTNAVQPVPASTKAGSFESQWRNLKDQLATALARTHRQCDLSRTTLGHAVWRVHAVLQHQQEHKRYRYLTARMLLVHELTAWVHASWSSDLTRLSSIRRAGCSVVWSSGRVDHTIGLAEPWCFSRMVHSHLERYMASR